MRELKFRAWDEMGKIMHYDFQFIRSGTEASDWIVFSSDKQRLSDKPHPFNNPYPQQQLKIMQYTGKKDKNGREVYEGDILRYMLDTHVNIFVEPVKWDDELVHWRPFNDQCDYDGLLTVQSLSECVIIGNIYQNPEMLAKSRQSEDT